MKKTLLLFMAMFISLTACSENTEEPLPSPEPVIQEETEPVFRTFRQSDFRQITMDTSVSHEDIPVEYKVIDLSGIDFGTRHSPCQDDLSKFPSEPDEENGITQEDIDHINMVRTTDAKGSMKAWTYDGDYLYFFVDYDSLNDGGHEAVLYRCDPDTLALTEIKEYSDPAVSMNYSDMAFAGGKLYLIGWVQYGDSGVLDCIDPETGEISRISDRCDQIYDTDGTRLLTLTYAWEKDELPALWELDSEGKSLTKIADIERVNLPKFYGDGFAKMTYGSDRLSTVETPDYRLETDLKQAELVEADERFVTLLMQDHYIGAGRQLYRYDLEKMECCVMDMGGVRPPYYGAGEYMVSVDNDLNIILPELAKVFLAASECNAEMKHYPGGLCGIDRSYLYQVDIRTYILPDKLYIFN